MKVTTWAQSQDTKQPMNSLTNQPQDHITKITQTNVKSEAHVK